MLTGRTSLLSTIAVASVLLVAHSAAADFGGDSSQMAKSGVSALPQSTKAKTVIKQGKKKILIHQEIRFNSSVCRWYNQDVEESFIDPSYPGYEVEKAVLSVEFGDADFYSHHAFVPELDVVQFGPETIGLLKGRSGEWKTERWDVSKQVHVNPPYHRIPFKINVDTGSSYPRWCLYLKKVVLVTKYKRKGKMQPPCYGIPGGGSGGNLPGYGGPIVLPRCGDGSVFPFAPSAPAAPAFMPDVSELSACDLYIKAQAVSALPGLLAPFCELVELLP